jgi:hypothetical protein
VFVRYKIISKGYKFWEPNTKRWGEGDDVIFYETSTYNVFVSKLTHFIELLQVGIEQAPTLIAVTQPFTIGVMGATQPLTMVSVQPLIVGT